MPKETIKLVRTLPVKEKAAKINMSVDVFLKLALNAPIKNSKINKK